MERLAVYPGSFDPITNGHLDIIKRGLRFFDKLIILIAYNPNKSGLFSVEERMELIRQVVGDDPRIRVDSFSGLLVNYVRDSGATVILRGLRALVGLRVRVPDGPHQPAPQPGHRDGLSHDRVQVVLHELEPDQGGSQPRRVRPGSRPRNRSPETPGEIRRQFQERVKDMKLGPLTKVLRPSPTLAVTMKAKALQKEGRDIIGFGAGEPDFDTPDNIKAAAIRAIEEGFTKYTPVGGIDELKDAVIEKLRKDNGLVYKRSQIVVSTGAKHTLFNMAQVLFGQGDEVIIPAPYWVSYPDIVLLADATPVFVDGGESEGFKLTPAKLKKAITAKTKALILNSPSNPTGAAYTLDELKGLAEVLKGTEIIVVSDDIYEKVVYDDFRFSNMANVSEEMKEKTIVVNGLSKSHAMTGWRMGYAAGPDNVIAAMTEIQSQSTSNATSIVQKASIEALLGDQSFIPKMVAEFKKRRDVIVGALNDIPGITCAMPPGAFYVFPRVSALYGRKYQGKTIATSNDFSEFLLEAANVAVVPGGAFGNDDYIRLSYATSMELIVEGVKRIAGAVAKLD